MGWIHVAGNCLHFVLVGSLSSTVSWLCMSIFFSNLQCWSLLDVHISNPSSVPFRYGRLHHEHYPQQHMWHWSVLWVVIIHIPSHKIISHSFRMIQLLMWTQPSALGGCPPHTMSNICAICQCCSTCIVTRGTVPCNYDPTKDLTILIPLLYPCVSCCVSPSIT